MNSRQVKIKVRPHEIMRFPGICVHCAHPASEKLQLQKRSGRTIRQIDVPLCEKCAKQLGRESGEEERLQKLSRLLTAIAVVVTLLIVLLAMSGTVLWLRAILALLLGAGVAGIVTWLFRSAISKAALPEKKAILQSAQLETFSWRTTTFLFFNETFVERFEELNKSLLVET